MFERYTERARRVIFFARYEASQFGSTRIETEHFLLGLIREDKLLLRRLLPDSKAIEDIREQINQQDEIRKKTSTSIDLPLSEECKHILGYAAEEGEIIGTGQLLLGILREENCLAAKILTGLGLHIVVVRGEVSKIPQTPMQNPISRMPQYQEIESESSAPVVPDAETATQIAKAVWGKRMSGVPWDDFEALSAALTFGVWIVTGSAKSQDGHTMLAAFIQKEDGKILRLHQETLNS